MEGLSFLISKIGPAVRKVGEVFEAIIDGFFNGLDKAGDGLDTAFDFFDDVKQNPAAALYHAGDIIRPAGVPVLPFPDERGVHGWHRVPLAYAIPHGASRRGRWRSRPR